MAVWSASLRWLPGSASSGTSPTWRVMDWWARSTTQRWRWTSLGLTWGPGSWLWSWGWPLTNWSTHKQARTWTSWTVSVMVLCSDLCRPPQGRSIIQEMSLFQVRREVALGAPTTVKGTMAIGWDTSRTLPPAAIRPGTPPQSLRSHPESERETTIGGPRSVGMAVSTLAPAGPPSACFLLCLFTF